MVVAHFRLGLDSELSPQKIIGGVRWQQDGGRRSEVGEALPTLVTWRRFLSGVLPGIGEDEVTNHSLVTRVSLLASRLKNEMASPSRAKSYLLFLVQFAHELIERRKLAFWDSTQFPNDLTFVICISNRFFLHRFFCLFANSLAPIMRMVSPR